MPRRGTVLLQMRLPTDLFEAFSEAVGADFVYRQGSKSLLFTAIWTAFETGDR